MDPSKSYCHGSSTQSQQNSSSSSSVQQHGGELVSKTNNKSQLNSTTGNYINVVPVPIGVQYHRRKLTPQDYQPRLYYNNSDYRCREDFYPIASTAAGVVGTPSSSTQQQQQQHLQHHHHHHQQHQQIDIVDQALNNSRVVATQTNNSNNCEQQVVSSIIANSGLNGVSNSSISTGGGGGNNGGGVVGCGTPVQPPPVLYTVHRVVTTAQIQTAGGNTFATSSSVSSVVSAVRNEIADCNNSAVMHNGANGLGVGSSGGASSTGLHSSPGML